MKKFIGLLLAASFVLAQTGFAANNEPVKLISYNLRNSNGKDGSNVWNNRRHATAEMIRRENPDVFGVQEALADQLAYIAEQCPEYGRVGVGRDDGEQKGEFMAVYYRTDRFELLDGNTFWLSKTPDEVSRGWDGACNRIVTWVKLKEKTTGKILFYFNTHLDHKGKVARKESIPLLVEKMSQIAGKKSAIVVGGDFNSSTESAIFNPLKKWMSDARVKAAQSDDKGTFNGFGSAPDTIVIDHLFFRGNIRCATYATLDGNYGAPYISDHYPIEMIFTLN